MRSDGYSGGGVVEAGEGEWICWGGRELVQVSVALRTVDLGAKTVWLVTN